MLFGHILLHRIVQNTKFDLGHDYLGSPLLHVETKIATSTDPGKMSFSLLKISRNFGWPPAKSYKTIVKSPLSAPLGIFQFHQDRPVRFTRPGTKDYTQIMEGSHGRLF